jgi:hypothetical protein
MNAVLLSILMIATLAVSDLGQVAVMDRSIEKEVVVDASLEDVWKAWTTNEGARTFLPPTPTSTQSSATGRIPYGRLKNFLICGQYLWTMYSVLT